MPEQDSTAPQPFVAETATEIEGLALGGLTLIGIFGAEGARRALLRDAEGVVMRVAVGDETPKGTVVAIGPDQVHLARAGRVTELLGLPGA